MKYTHKITIRCDKEYLANFQAFLKENKLEGESQDAICTNMRHDNGDILVEIADPDIQVSPGRNGEKHEVEQIFLKFARPINIFHCHEQNTKHQAYVPIDVLVHRKKQTTNK